jgi:GNAT superfamily N-acetyltransferase
MVRAELGGEILRRLPDGLLGDNSFDWGAVITMAFFAEPMDTPGLLEDLVEQAPENPFCTPSYFSAMRRLGAEPWIVGLREDEQLLSAAGAFITRGRLNSSLEIVSLPPAAGVEGFWFGLLQFAAEHRITQIEANSFASPPVTIPMLKQEKERRDRCEYVIDLPEFNLGRMSSNHKRNIRKAKGVTITRSVDQSACREHLRLMGLSLDRRRQRGEEVADGSAMTLQVALLECGSGELFQATLEGSVLSSILVLRSSSGAYYQSAGTSPQGMTSGASHFLINGIACLLREDGLRTFNLGGAPPESSLARFKIGFGATAVPLTAVSLNVGPAWRRRLTTLLQLAKGNRRALLGAVAGNLRFSRIYVGETSATMAQTSAPVGEFRPLSDDDLRTLETGDGGFRQRQLDRLARFGRSYAFGVVVEGKLAHVSWLLPAAAVRMDSPDILRLRDDQAEITACETLPDFRGMGIYSFAISELFAVARQRGIVRIYMKTAWDNKPSQRGIRKAGLKGAGLALLLTPPLSPGRTWVFRLFC